MHFQVSADASGLLDDLRRKAAVEIPLDTAWRAGAVYLRAMYARFERGGDGEWAPLKETTKKAKAAKGQNPDATNIGDGRLLDSLRPGAGENILDVGSDGADCGTSVPYAAYVQAQRPFLVDPDPQTEAEILRIVRDDMEGV